MTSKLQSVKIGQDAEVVLPIEVRDRLGVTAGDDLVLLETLPGVLITTREKLVHWALDGIGAALREQGVTLDDLMTSGATIRQEIYDERYKVLDEFGAAFADVPTEELERKVDGALRLARVEKSAVDPSS